MWSTLRSVLSITFAFNVASGTSDLFTATQDMQESIGTENTALEDGYLYLMLEQRRLEKAIEHYRALRTAKSLRDGLNTLGTFLFISRLANSYPKFSAPCPSLFSLPSAFLPSYSRRWWPTVGDLSGAAAGICKLQQAYDIPVDTIASMHSRLLPAVSPEDLAHVARGCFTDGEFGNTSAWSQAALAMTSPFTGGAFKRLELGLKILRTNDEVRRQLGQRAKYMSLNHYPSSPESDVSQYKSVCVRQGAVRSSGSRLVCKMSTNFGDPRLILQPLKLEVLSLKPRVVLIGDFLSPSEVNYIRSAAQKGFKRAGVYSPTDTAGMPSWKRIGKVSWLWDHEHGPLQHLTRRIGAATGLSVETAEAYQVANYGLGGHYTPHLDAHGFGEVAHSVDTEDGNRLATTLMYLTDVAAGGATAFVKLGIAVKPRVGDALFWYDLEPYAGDDAPQHFSFWHQKRRADDLSLHVGCPVLWGSKWIVTKWIRERTNAVVHYDTPG
ncbi:prolyl 4-hydroxylase subunit alpha-1-like [Dermacentor albipictus]|uniref:prolyl 4-hydroxylase subunit alpha-1-like n=1 Tax=Dermacentor albipictus TaxID=60249 RepID=UPI0038FC35A9